MSGNVFMKYCKLEKAECKTLSSTITTLKYTCFHVNVNYIYLTIQHKTVNTIGYFSRNSQTWKAMVIFSSGKQKKKFCIAVIKTLKSADG